MLNSAMVDVRQNSVLAKGRERERERERERDAKKKRSFAQLCVLSPWNNYSSTNTHQRRQFNKCC